MHFIPLHILFLFGGNLFLWGWWIRIDWTVGEPPVIRTLMMIFFGILVVYMFGRMHFLPLRLNPEADARISIMIAGRFLAYRGMYYFFLEIFFLLFSYSFFRRLGVSQSILISNIIFGIISPLFTIFNGACRMFFTSRRLSILRRVVILLTMWVPVVNWIVLGYTGHIVHMEYDFALYKKALENTRVESDMCRTKYPFIFVHGVLFRDLKYFNYWGRIPKILKKHGAQIYYGHQEAAGGYPANAEKISAMIRKVCAETGCEKVNIIAHSKGGLDARYAISCKGMEAYVASLTMLNVPNRGSYVMDILCKLPEGIYRFLAKIFNWIFHKMGDENPDFYVATRELTTDACARFNQQVPDSPQVYYQSYMSVMKNLISDSLLFFPYLMIRSAAPANDRKNDGLITISSAWWGKQKALFSTKSRRGISHGDMIDLKREDFKGFDVQEMYMTMVSDLKKMGF